MRSSKYHLIFFIGTFILLSMISSKLTLNSVKHLCVPTSQSNTNEVHFVVNINASVKTKSDAINATTCKQTHTLPSCVILVRYVNGRLGNHLFMFASAYGLSRIHGCSLYIGKNFKKELHKTFELNLANEIGKETVPLLEKQNITSQRSVCYFDAKLMRPEAVKYFELTGYWQTHGYFSGYMDEIRAVLSFKPSIVRITLPFLNSLLTKPLIEDSNPNFRTIKEYIKTTSPVTWVGIHIRRGDYRTYRAFRHGRTVSTKEFFDKAIAYFSRRYENRTLFIVASDDKSYCRKIFQNRRNIIITPDSFTPAADLAMLSLCTDVIASSGSFSWWAAALAGGIVLHDEQYPRRNSSLEGFCPRSMYYPPWFLFL